MRRKIRQTTLRGLDPLLGYTYDGPQDLKLVAGETFSDGVVWIGDRASDHWRVGILGGSTSDVWYNGSWLRPLRSIAQGNDKPLLLISGAVSGYSSGQELIKLIRDVLPARPDLVITLNGINDLGFIQAGDPAYPMIHQYQLKLFRFLVSRYGGNEWGRSFWNQVASKSRIRPGAMNSELTLGGLRPRRRDDMTPWEHWYRNVRLARAACEEFGVHYCCFLQPILGVGEYEMTAEESHHLKAFANGHRGVHGQRYEDAVREFYHHARELAGQDPTLVVDLVDAFREHEEVYDDSRHPNKKGYRLLAQNIFDHLMARGWLTNRAWIKSR